MPKRKVSVRKFGAYATIAVAIFAAGVTRIHFEGTFKVSWEWPPGTESRKSGKATKHADVTGTRKLPGKYDGGFDLTEYDPGGYDPTEPDRKSSAAPGHDLSYLATRASGARSGYEDVYTDSSIEKLRGYENHGYGNTPVYLDKNSSIVPAPKRSFASYGGERSFADYGGQTSFADYGGDTSFVDYGGGASFADYGDKVRRKSLTIYYRSDAGSDWHRSDPGSDWYRSDLASDWYTSDLGSGKA